jgi:SAM-dependent methyltransferase
MRFILLAVVCTLTIITARAVDTLATTTFTSIYNKNFWSKGSGPGSTPEYTSTYRESLIATLRRLNVTTILDVGCGDWQFSRLIDWTGFNYTGIDCVKFLIDNHNNMFGKANIKFVHHDILTQEWMLSSPSSPRIDAVILKDVIQHWPDADMKRILASLRTQARWLLVTNCADQKDGHDIPLGGFRSLSHKMQPLASYSPQLIHVFRNKEFVLIPGLP